MNLELLLAVGSSIASAATASYAVRILVRHMETECELRLAAFREGLERP